ncbi:MAG: hypothetical protein MUO72_19850 [Bacteroidales bacterium]|nr:hypothetical protein [Bacteroidales bacterium]
MFLTFIFLISVGVQIQTLAGEVTLTAATVNQELSHNGKGLSAFAKTVEEKSNGKLKIKTFFVGQLGDASSAYQSVIDGDIDIIMIDAGWFSEKHPVFNILECFYLFKGSEHYVEVMNTPGKLKFFEDKILKDPGLKTIYYDGGDVCL